MASSSSSASASASSAHAANERVTTCTSEHKRVERRLNHYHTIIPLKQYPQLLRLDTLPFIILYTLLIFIEQGIITQNAMIQKWTHMLLFPLALLSHLALFLASHWKISIEAKVGYMHANAHNNANHRHNDAITKDICMDSWTHCLVIPPSVSHGGAGSTNSSKNKKDKKIAGASMVGRTEIVKVQKRLCENGNTVATISYEEIVFRCCLQDNNLVAASAGEDAEMDSIWNVKNSKSLSLDKHEHEHEESKEKEKAKSRSKQSDIGTDLDTSSLFHRLHYPIDLPLSFYLRKWTGHSKNSVKQARKVYSNNNLVVNLPPFIDLLRQQLLAPFFLFQQFCVLLWCLDEYWYYALFTLFTLVLFECTVAHTRLKNLQRLRETLRPPIKLWAYRENQWGMISSQKIVAGDIVSLSSTGTGTSEYNRQGVDQHTDGIYVPCDLLLLRGNAVLNEATLTGESIPQMKESIEIVASALSGVSSSTGTGTGADSEAILDMEDSTFKRAILFGGTVMMNHSNSAPSDDQTDSNVGADADLDADGGSVASKLPEAPDDGCIALVLRTGFDTQQGSLLRTMVHTSTKSQSDGVNTKDTFMFIVILLCCALLSAGFVLHHGWFDPTRNRFKLVLHVIIIITSVVPPELPMELSLAVTSSLADLSRRCNVFCTEPFRIPLAGMVDTCCFDKTGTLTSDEMVLRGVRLPIQNSSSKKLEITEGLVQPMKSFEEEDANVNSNANSNEVTELPDDVIRVMVGCQSLSKSGSNSSSPRSVIGNPMEKIILDSCGWRIIANNTVVPPDPLKNKQWLKIHHRFAFTSKLKRMTVISEIAGSKGLLALSKGAPETLKQFLDPATIPDTYDAISRHHMSMGQRVLALAYRSLGSKDDISKWKKRGRDAVECKLTFAGFIVLDCPVKPDTKKVIKELRKSGHHTVMITGDAVLTAAEVARQVGIIKAKAKANTETFELRQMHEFGSDSQNNQMEARFAFVPIKSINTNGTDNCIAYSASNLEVIKDMLETKSISAICVTGETLTKIATESVRKKMNSNSDNNVFIDPKTVLLHPDAQSTLQALVPLISVFARHAPRQKEAVVAAFNGAGRITLMCGDGTNDVGALKMSHCGISIISVPDVEAKQRDALDGLIESQQKKKKSKVKKQRKTWEQHLQDLAEAEEELNNVALGDASVASPFTSRTTSIKCTKDVLQRGRCTLVTMTQIYKILGVNCLVNALVLSSLHLIGVKQGDTQLTVVGIVVAGLFFFVTKGEPLSKLSRHRPPSSVLCKQVLVSIALQFSIHFICIMIVTSMSKSYLDPYDPSLVPDGAFNPNTLNSATFIMTVLTTVNTFVVNYRGRPYMQNLSENKMMMKGLQVCYVALFGCALEVFPPFNDLMQLAPLPAQGEEIIIDMAADTGHHAEFLGQLLVMGIQNIGFKQMLCALMVIDTTVSYVIEKALVNFFEPNAK